MSIALAASRDDLAIGLYRHPFSDRVTTDKMGNHPAVPAEGRIKAAIGLVTGKGEAKEALRSTGRDDLSISLEG